MQKAMVVLGATIIIVAVLGWIYLPKIYEKMFSGKFDTEVVVLRVEEDDVPRDESGTSFVKRTIVDIRMTFPYGKKPKSFKKMVVLDESDKDVEASWDPNPTWDDRPDEGIAIVEIYNFYFPVGFRTGKIQLDGKDIAELNLPDPPFNPSPDFDE